MSRVYEILSQQPEIVLQAGVPTQGFVIRVHLTQYDELAEIRVARLDPALIDGLIRALLDNRAKLAALGETGGAGEK